MVEQPQSQTSAPQEEELPIDIDYAKFLDWLIDRARIPRNWHVLLKSARALVRVALAATPKPALVALELESLPPLYNLHYYRVLDIRNALSAPDVPSEWNAGPDKDMIGRWKSPVVRAWSDAVSAFETKSIFLADSAQLLVRHADIEAVALKGAMSKLQTDAAEFGRREGPAIRSAAEAKQRFFDACREFELVDGENVDFEPQLRTEVEKRVPEVLRRAVALAKEERFIAAVRYYEEVARYVSAKEVQEETLCRTLRRVMEDDIDGLIREVGVSTTAEDTIGGAVGADIDWSAMLSTGEVPDGMEVASSNEPAEIDWGIEIDTSGTGAELEQTNNAQPIQTSEGGGINWGDEVEITSVPTVEDEVNDECAEEADAISLADPKVRELYLTDLLELDAFLAQRCVELSRSGNSEVGLVMQQASNASDSIKSVDSEKVTQMRDAVQSAIQGVNSAETRRILALKSNSKSLERVARSVLEKKHVAERMHGAIDILRNRRAKAAAELAEETPKLEVLANVTRDVKSRTEKALSGLYRGRTVNILGEINNVFPPLD